MENLFEPHGEFFFVTTLNVHGPENRDRKHWPVLQQLAAKFAVIKRGTCARYSNQNIV